MSLRWGVWLYWWSSSKHFAQVVTATPLHMWEQETPISTISENVLEASQLCRSLVAHLIIIIIIARNSRSFLVTQTPTRRPKK